MQLLEKEMRMIFPTALFTGKLSDLAACDRAEKKLRDMQKSGQGASEDRFYMTPDNIQHLPEMADLVDVIMKEADEILNVYKVKRESHYITNMWANITHPNHRHHMHVHPNCLLSGILYVNAPTGAGATIFGDPRLNARWIEPSYTEMNVHNMNVIAVAPEKGRMLMWPSYLSHGVENGKARDSEDRIVIAFNVMIRGLIDRLTARLELR